ncbi:MAG TPA: potassium transporter TrkG, partial [Kiloniellales bacterium]|nr:potassium transporter TrkG [Kiloniellales bacterium]
CAVLALALWLVIGTQETVADALRLAAFNVTSIITTTGYATADYGIWGPFAVVLFFVLTFVGGCTGSTVGAVKIFRFEIMGRVVVLLLRRLQYPHGIFPPTYMGKRVDTDVMSGVIAFFALFVASFVALSLLLGFAGLDFVTAVSGAATAIGNVGPGLGPIIGPAGNFSSLPDVAKWLLAGGMLLGRLEIFTVLVLLLPSFWRP